MALFEIADDIVESGKILPIIEPVNTKDYTFRHFNKFVEKNLPFILVTNPTEGELINQSAYIKEQIIDNIIDEYDNYHLAFIITTRTTLKDINNFLEEYSNNQVCFIHFYPFQNTDNLIAKFNEYTNISYQIFFGDKVSADYISKFESNNKVILKDEFRREIRNADYEAQEYYSDLYRTYISNGFVGFGDFSIIGDFFISGSGGPAHAVAIHYTYVNNDDNGNLWMKHFVSDDQEGAQNPGGKFIQALNKCVEFLNQNDPRCNKCEGCQEFISYYNRQHYPGLGTVKKLSLKHHIKLILNLI